MQEKRAMNIELVDAYGDNGLRVSVETGSLILQVPTIDALIEELGKFRSDMRPCIPPDISRTKQHPVEIDPVWHVEYNPLLNGSVVFFRHSGLGWTCFALPRPSLEKLVEVLSNHLQTTVEVEGAPN